MQQLMSMMIDRHFLNMIRGQLLFVQRMSYCSFDGTTVVKQGYFHYDYTSSQQKNNIDIFSNSLACFSFVFQYRYIGYITLCLTLISKYSFSLLNIFLRHLFYIFIKSYQLFIVNIQFCLVKKMFLVLIKPYHEINLMKLIFYQNYRIIIDNFDHFCS